MQPTIIALYSGAPRMGKSTVANWLIRERGFVRVPFAQPLKHMCRPLFEALGYGPSEISLFENGDKTKEIQDTGKTVRRIYQSLGTEWGRKLIHPDLWVRAWTHTVLSEMVKGTTKIVADDCRYLNEANAVERMGGTIYEVFRQVVTEQKVMQHSSESQLDEYEYTIIPNVGSLNDTHALLSKMFPA